jgi:hypothetical protein
MTSGDTASSLQTNDGLTDGMTITLSSTATVYDCNTSDLPSPTDGWATPNERRTVTILTSSPDSATPDSGRTAM